MSYDFALGLSQLVASFVFLSVLVGVATYVFWPSNASRFEKAAHVALDDAEAITQRAVQ